MRPLRPSLASLVSMALLGAAFAHGCGSDADAPPGSNVTGGNGGTGGTTDASTGGIPGIDVKNDSTPIPCDDPTDSDGDNIADTLETAADSDKDGTPDAQDADSDADGLTDSDEAENPALPAGTPGQSRSDAC